MSNSRRKRNQPARRPQRPARRPGDPAGQQRQQITEFRHESYSAPWPPAAEVERLNQQDPRAARIIFDNFDEQGRNRRDLEQKIVTGSERRADRGQIIGAAFFFAALVSGVIIALAADPKAGAGIIIAALASGSFIYVVGGRPPKPDGPPPQQ